MASGSSPHSRRFPGRFPSPTPSMASITHEDLRTPIPLPRTPNTRIRIPVRSFRGFSVDPTASTATPQPSCASEAEHDEIPSQVPHRNQYSQVFGAASDTSSYTPITRPPANRSAVSDPRYDRPTTRLSQNYGSPSRITKRGRRRLDNAPRSYSNPVPKNLSAASFADPNAKKFASSARTSQEIHDVLKARLRKTLTPDNAKGVVYIVRDPTRPHLLKIGASMHFSQRKEELERECKLKLEVVHVSDEFENYIRAEHLVHGDLLHLCRKHTCKVCKKVHKEWHEISEELAIKTTERWVRFMRDEQPYSRRGELKSIWIFLMHKRRPTSSNYDHDSRCGYWSHIIQSPSAIDYCEQAFNIWKVHPLWWSLWEFSWQASTVLSWAILLLLSMNIVALFLFSLSLFCACLSVATKSKKGRRS